MTLYKGEHKLLEFWNGICYYKFQHFLHIEYKYFSAFYIIKNLISITFMSPLVLSWEFILYICVKLRSWEKLIIK